MPSDTYSSVPSTGKLKLKGVTDSRIDKKKKKKKPKQDGPSAVPEQEKSISENIDNDQDQETDSFVDRSVILKSLEDEDAKITRSRNEDDVKTLKATSLAKPTSKDDVNIDEMNRHLKTSSELRFEQQRRKRLEERLKRDGGLKTHKQRVEELNRYLSGLSEHHDMPKIGPG